VNVILWTLIIGGTLYWLMIWQVARAFSEEREAEAARRKQIADQLRERGDL
jgi:hypothetical protein